MKIDLTKYGSQPLFKARPGKAPTKTFERSANLVLSDAGKDLIVIRDYEDVKLQTLVAYDVVLLDYYNRQKASQLLAKIRASVFDELYLKPVVISTHGTAVSQTDIELADAVIKGKSIEPVLDLIDTIESRIEEVLNVTSDFKGRKVLLKLIRFLYTRSGTLNPVPSAKSHMGYAFPFLDANINEDEYQELVELLEVGETTGLLQSDLIDHVHLCQSCHSGFINYRETCPKCDSHKFKTEHTIHHFVCGYVGPESDFEKGNQLECPKCSRQLRHIGVDYDKPSLVMECENGHIFQEPDMKTLCFNCHTEAEPQSLLTYPIRSFELTSSGSETALSGRVKGKEAQAGLEGFMSLSIFKTMLKLELERLKLNEKTSTLSFLHTMFCPTTYKKHEHDFKDFMQEVARIIKNQLLPTQLICQVDEEVFLLLTPEQDIINTNSQLENIKNTTLKMIRSQCHGNKSDEMVFESFDLAQYQQIDEVLGQLNQRVNIF